MDTIRVNTDLLEDCAGLIGTCGTSASSLAQEIAQVLSSLPESCTEKYSRVISSYKKEMQSISNDLGYLKTGVTKAARLFDECEQTLQQGVPSESGEGAFASGSAGGVSEIDWNSWPFSWIDAVLDFLNIDKYGRNCTEEEMHDDIMRNQINDLFDNDYYGEKNWNNSTTEEKQQILNDFKNEINAIFGIEVTADIQYYNGAANSNGYYTDTDNTINLNANTFETRSREDLMTTVVHEMRHAYQYAVINDPDSYIVSEETVNAWSDNWIDYISYEPELNNYDDYKNQPIEADAFGYSESVTYNKGFNWFFW